MKKQKFNKAVKLYIEQGTTLRVLFDDGITKELDIKTLLNKLPVEYNKLTKRDFFLKGRLLGWGGIIWSKDVDLSVDTIYLEGKEVKSEPNALNCIIGFKVKQARLEKELSQTELAELAQIDQSEISKLEKGLFNPSINFLVKVFAALNKKIEFKIQ